MKSEDDFEEISKEIEKDDRRRENLVTFIVAFLFVIICISAFFSVKSYLAKHMKITKKELVVNQDTNGDNLPDLNIDYKGSNLALFNIDNDANKTADFNLLNNKYKDNMQLNIDNDKDNHPDINIDMDGDGVPEVNLLNRDINQDDIAELNIDSNNDGYPDYNIDVDGNGVCDLLCNENIPNSSFNTTEFKSIMGENTGMSFYIYWLDGFTLSLVNDELSKESFKEFIIENGSNEASTYKIKLTGIDNKYAKEDLLAYKVYCDGVGCGEIPSNRKLEEKEEQIIFNKIVIPAHTVHKYKIKLKSTSQAVDLNKKYSAVIEITGVNK